MALARVGAVRCDEPNEVREWHAPWSGRALGGQGAVGEDGANRLVGALDRRCVQQSIHLPILRPAHRPGPRVAEIGSRVTRQSEDSDASHPPDRSVWLLDLLPVFEMRRAFVRRFDGATQLVGSELDKALRMHGFRM